MASILEVRRSGPVALVLLLLLAFSSAAQELPGDQSLPPPPATEMLESRTRIEPFPIVLLPPRMVLEDRSGETNEIVLAAVGDVMLGSTYPDASGASLPPNDGQDLLTEVAPLLSRADITFGNLEGPMLEGGTTEKCRHARPGFCYVFRMPPQYAANLKAAGFNVMGVANNHAADFGEEGRASTRRALDAAGIAYSGEIGDIARFLVKGRRVDLIAFSTSPGTYSLLRTEEAAEVVRAAAREADIVIVSFHGGGEGDAYQFIPRGNETFLGENRGNVIRFAHAMIDAGADVVWGHGPHVVRAMEFYRGRLIAYSLGNFATFGTFDLDGPGGLSLILEVHLGLDGAFHSAWVHPIRQQKPGGPKLDPEGSILPILQRLSVRQFGARGAVVSASGELRARASKSR